MIECEPEQDEPLAVYWFNWPVLKLFSSTWNSWRKVVIQNRVVRDGIDWAQIESALNLSGIDRAQWPRIFASLNEMEAAALNYLDRD